jgi:hypothetical protein
MMSPTLMPAAAAAPPAVTSRTLAPTTVGFLTLVSSCTSLTEAPSRPCVAVPVSMISLAMRCARFDGMAKPTPMLPDCPPELELPAEAMATLMPMTLPSESRSAPPELPGLIAASVCTTEREIVDDDVGAVVPGRSKLKKFWSGVV